MTPNEQKTFDRLLRQALTEASELDATELRRFAEQLMGNRQAAARAAFPRSGFAPGPDSARLAELRAALMAADKVSASPSSTTEKAF